MKNVIYFIFCILCTLSFTFSVNADFDPIDNEARINEMTEMSAELIEDLQNNTPKSVDEHIQRFCDGMWDIIMKTAVKMRKDVLMEKTGPEQISSCVKSQAIKGNGPTGMIVDKGMMKIYDYTKKYTYSDLTADYQVIFDGITNVINYYFQSCVAADINNIDTSNLPPVVTVE